jgi:hypothetical protein
MYRLAWVDVFSAPEQMFHAAARVPACATAVRSLTQQYLALERRYQQTVQTAVLGSSAATAASASSLSSSSSPSTPPHAHSSSLSSSADLAHPVVLVMNLVFPGAGAAAASEEALHSSSSASSSFPSASSYDHLVCYFVRRSSAEYDAAEREFAIRERAHGGGSAANSERRSVEVLRQAVADLHFFLFSFFLPCRWKKKGKEYVFPILTF